MESIVGMYVHTCMYICTCIHITDTQHMYAYTVETYVCTYTHRVKLRSANFVLNLPPHICRYIRTYICTYIRTYVHTHVCVHTILSHTPGIMEYGSTPYVGLTRKKHGRHTLVQILFSSEN